MNAWVEKPEVTEPTLPASWTCPITGLTVPLAPAENLKYRLALLDACEADPTIRQDVYTACSQSILYWIVAFNFTLRVFESDGQGKQQQADNAHVPFCLWPIQMELALKLQKCVADGEELLVDKSRDMGATWTILVVLLWFFLFRPNQSLLMLSRKEDAVDMLDGTAKNYPSQGADPGTLFGKLDYVLGRLPEWMLPRMSRKAMHLVNVDNKSRIDGESSNATAGSSDRRTAIFLDEMAKMKEGESIKRSTRDVTACRIVCSTPNGAGTAFSKWRMSGQIEVFSLMWFTHPEKGRGLEAKQDKLGRWKLHSPWYDRECELRSPREVAIEIDADHIGSGETFFEPQILEQHKKLHARPPRNSYTVTFKKKFSDHEMNVALRDMDLKVVSRTPGGPLKCWVELINGRLDQSKTYILSIDISKGQGASNSVINIGCVETREKVAEWADANTPPYELARICCALAIWVGGRSKRPLVIFENNGDPGLDFGRQLVHTYHYPNVYFDRQQGTLRQRVGKRYGWRSNTDKKAEALGLLRRAYAHGKYINRSALALTEAATYIHYEAGGIGPAELVSESPSARKAHGDRVIADMLFLWALQDAGRISKLKETHPKKSIGGRMDAWRKKRKLAKSGQIERTFDFSGAT